MRKIIVVVILSIIGIQMQAQYDGEMKHWNFDGSAKNYSSILRGIPSAILCPGIKDLGLYMDGEKTHLKLIEGLDITDDFSLGFWFKTIVPDQGQTIFFQSKQSQKDSTEKRFIHFFSKENKLFIQQDNIIVPIKNAKIDNNVWYYLVYTYDGFESKIHLQGKEIYSTSNVSIFTKISLHTDLLSIGKASKGMASLEGTIDEITSYNKALPADRIMEFYHKRLPKGSTEEPEVDSSELIKSEPIVKKVVEVKEIINKNSAEEFKGRTNDIQAQIGVQSLNIELEVWDYDEYDQDRITVSMNNSTFIDPMNTNRLLPKKRNKHTFKFIILPQEVNYITFYASDLGQFDSQNTVAVRVWDGNKRLDNVYKLILTEEKNAVIELKHLGETPISLNNDIAIRDLSKEETIVINKTTQVNQKPIIDDKPVITEPELIEINPKPKEDVFVQPPKVKKEKPVKEKLILKSKEPKEVKPEPAPEYISVLDYDILDAVIVHSTDIKLELVGNKSNEEVKINVSLDEKRLSKTPYLLKGNTSDIRFNVDTRKESVITIESYQLQKNKKTKLTARLYADDKLVKEFSLRLEKYNAMIPLAFVPKPGSSRPGNKRTIVVRSTSLSIKVKDNSKVDGDIITIKHDGKSILEEHLLTEEFHEVPLNLLANGTNKLIFIPVSMGKASTENTAWVQIISEGKVIHEFSLRSQNANQPATLTIVHEDKK